MSNKLLLHQKNVSRVLVARNREQKGLLAIHGLGTGKTMTGIAFAENYPRKRIIVVVPIGLNFVWDEEKQKLGVFRSYEYVFFGSEELRRLLVSPEVLRNVVLIVDEAHKLAMELQTYDVSSASKAIENLKTVHKVLLLTGTPIYSSTDNLRWLINIAAGKVALPFSSKQFDKMYYKINTGDAVMHGWTQNVLRSMIPLLVIMLYLYVIPGLDLSQYMMKLKQSYRENPYETTAALSMFAHNQNPTATMEDLNLKQAVLSSTIVHDFSTRFSVPKEAIPNMLSGLASKSNLSKVNEIYEQIANVPQFPKIIDALRAFGRRVHERSGIPASTTVRLSVLIPFIILTMMTVLAFIKRQYTIQNSRVLNTDKIIQDSKRYVSVYFAEQDNKDFPAVDKYRMNVEYTEQQIDIWIRFTMGMLNPNELVQLGIYDTEAIATMFDNTTSNDIYRDNGRMIGNISPVGSETVHPIKFIKVAKTISNQPAVVYSNFKSSAISFTHFLNQNGIKASYFEASSDNESKRQILEDFKTRRIQVIVLDPLITEGVSVIGARQIHILEPIMEKAKRDQVIGRVVRYKSHTHLPKSEQHVAVYEWCCTVSSFMKQVQKTKSQVETWLKDQPDIIYPMRTLTFNQDITPDDLVMREQEKTGSIISTLIYKYAMHSVDSGLTEDMTDDPCCIWEIDQICNNKTPCQELDFDM